MLVDAGVDMDLIRLNATPYSLLELQDLIPRLFDQAQELALNVNSAAPSGQWNDAILGLPDLHQLKTLDDQQMRALKELGLAAVEKEEDIPMAVPGWDGTPEPTHS